MHYSYFCFSIFIVLFQFHEIIGTLTSTGSTSIVPSISNEEESANYEFTFTPSIYIPKNGSIEVIFPPEYMSTLGIPIVYDTTCSIPCEINEKTVKFYFEEEITSG